MAAGRQRFLNAELDFLSAELDFLSAELKILSAELGKTGWRVETRSSLHPVSRVYPAPSLGGRPQIHAHST